MFSDKKLSYIFSLGTLAALLLLFLFSPPLVGRIGAALCLLAAGVAATRFLKKRNIPSVNRQRVWLVMLASALLYITLYYLVGVRFGFYQNDYGLRTQVILRYLLPIGGIIFFGEVLRHVLLSQQKKGVTLLAYFIGLAGEVLTFTTLHGVGFYSTLMDLLGKTLFPAVVAHLLYQYLSKRYGIWPSVTFRLITVLTPYAIPFSPDIPPVMAALVALLLPLLLYWFIDILFEHKKKYALQRRPRWVRTLRTVASLLVLVLMLGTALVISNRFHYGTYIIATSSMETEISPGDAVLYERWEGEFIAVGEILVFEREGTVVVHRIVDAHIVNGEYRYYTKGDANKEMDEGYVTHNQVIGVVRAKVAFIGSPVLWARRLFST